MYSNMKLLACIRISTDTMSAGHISEFTPHSDEHDINECITSLAAGCVAYVAYSVSDVSKRSEQKHPRWHFCSDPEP